MATNPDERHDATPDLPTEAVNDATVAEPPAPQSMPFAAARPSRTAVDSRIVIGRGRRLFKLPSKDSGFYGSGSNAALGDDNSARETTPGFQQDKWERGTLMPR